MSRRLRVVHVITTLTTGGAERQLAALAAASRHDVSVIALYEGGLVADALVADGVPVQVLGMAGWRKAFAVPRLARLLRRLAPDVVHVHLLSAQLWGIPAARIARVPVVVSTEHSIMETTIEGRRKSAPLRLLYLALERLATRTVAVSVETERRLRAWGLPAVRTVEVVNPPIDFARFAAPPPDRQGGDDLRAELGIAPQTALICTVGRLVAEKRTGVLVRALADLLRTGDVALVIAGDGPLRAEVAQVAADLEVAERVHLIGPVADVGRVFRAADVFVSASRDETFGMAIVEALGSGLPVVCIECPALDGLALPATRVRRIDAPADTAAERTEIAAAVRALLDAGRDPVPPGLVDRYGVAGTAERVDALYDGLSRAPGR